MDVVRNTITGEKGLGGIETGFYELDYLFNIMKSKQGTYVSYFLKGNEMNLDKSGKSVKTT